MRMDKHQHIKGNFELMAQVNSKLVLDAVCQAGEISRAELARKTGLQLATVGNTVARLIAGGFLVDEDAGKAPSGGVGRPSRVVRLNKNSRLILAVDLEPDRLRISLVNLTLEVIAYSEYGLNRFDSSQKILGQIISGCRNLLSANDSWRRKLLKLGLSLPGDVDVEMGIARSSTNMPNWHDVSVVRELSSALQVPVKIGKSIHLAALSEKWRRPEIRDRNVLCLVLRTGVGVALLVKGSLYYGASHLDGEIGHTIVDMNGEQCECGKRGCLENFISSKSIRRRAVRAIEAGRAGALLEAAGGDADTITPEMIYELAKNGDGECELIVRDVARYLGLEAANLVQILNPHEVVICGSIDLAEDIIREEINSVFTEVLLPKTRADVKVLLSPYRDRAALLGAAVMILDELFDLPNLTFPSINGSSKEASARCKRPNRRQSVPV